MQAVHNMTDHSRGPADRPWQCAHQIHWIHFRTTANIIKRISCWPQWLNPCIVHILYIIYIKYNAHLDKEHSISHVPKKYIFTDFICVFHTLEDRLQNLDVHHSPQSTVPRKIIKISNNKE